MLTMRTAVLAFVIGPGAWPAVAQSLQTHSPSQMSAVETVELPAPSAPLSIGTKIYNWVDYSRHEQASKKPSDSRQLMVQVWYPTEDRTGPTSPYVPMLSSYRHIWEDSDVDAASRTVTHSRTTAKPMSGPQFPVVLLSHGWEGTRSEYTSLAEDLASHGYAVFGVDHPYMGRIALPNGEVTEPNESQFHSPTEIVAYYARDLEFVIGQIDKLNQADREKTFIDRFDMQRIAAIGHSSGFVAASGACKLDSRIKACINIDAPGFGAGDLAGLEQPLLWIRLQKASAVPAEYLKTARTMVYELQIVGANHGSAEDWDYLKATSGAQREAAGRVLEILRQYLEAFLSQYLNRQNSDLLEPGSGKPGIRWRVYTPAISRSETQGSRVEGYAYISPHSPRIRVNVDRSFDYVGKVPFTIDNVAAGNRYVFVHTTRDKHVQRMFIIQQEAFLPSSNDTYKYRFTNPVKLGSFEYQHSVEIYDNVAAIREEPGKEGDATKRFLEAQGLSLESGLIMSRFARPADLRHKHEIIFFCYENFSSYGHKLTDFREGTDSADKQNIKRKVDENCRSAFQVTD